MRLPQHKPVIYLLTCLLAAAVAVGPGFHAQEECLEEAWKFFNQEKYQEAIKFADKCIDQFGKQADITQAAFVESKEPLPRTGKVSEAEKARIFSRGILNDVATAYFIKGRSAEYLYKKGGPQSSLYRGMAEQAYKTTCQYKHGRAWNPKKREFWSPCEAATYRPSLK
jgi:hypothetical protein